MTKISIIGAGSVGDAAAYYIAQKDIVDELVLLDIV
ncbi:MAG: malate dehydrogenase, partial [Deltaproteobacteria bacterium]|nr:malate dehydrogenase [Deltaproteobacteria bacterium]